MSTGFSSVPNNSNAQALSFPDPQDLRFPEWQGLYNAAVLEADESKLLQRVEAAESAMFERLKALSGNPDDAIECEAICLAMPTPGFLRRDAVSMTPEPHKQ